MDQALSSVIIALITGIGSIITLVIQKRSDKVVNKIDKQAAFIEREKEIKYKLIQKKAEKESIIHSMMILILDTNLYIMNNSQLCEKDPIPIDDALKQSEELKAKFVAVCNDIEDIQREYDLLLDMSSDYGIDIPKD